MSSRRNQDSRAGRRQSSAERRCRTAFPRALGHRECPADVRARRMRRRPFASLRRGCSTPRTGIGSRLVVSGEYVEGRLFVRHVSRTCRLLRQVHQTCRSRAQSRMANFDPARTYNDHHHRSAFPICTTRSGGAGGPRDESGAAVPHGAPARRRVASQETIGHRHGRRGLSHAARRQSGRTSRAGDGARESGERPGRMLSGSIRRRSSPSAGRSSDASVGVAGPSPRVSDGRTHTLRIDEPKGYS